MSAKALAPTQSAVNEINAQKKARFVELYHQLNGHITQACQATGINRTTYYNWLEKDEAFAKAIMDAEAELNDEIRDVLINKAASGDMAAVIFYLKNRHPDFKQQHAWVQQINVGKEMAVEVIEE